MIAEQAFRETIHAHAGRGPDAERFVFARADLANIRRGVQKRRSLPVHRRWNVLVEDSDKVGIPDAEDDSIKQDGIPEAQLADVGFG
jgi:hypothetical protein